MTDIIRLGSIDFEIRRNIRRKKIAVGIDSYGKYFISCPYLYNANKLEALLAKDINELICQIEKKRVQNYPSHYYEDGEIFLYRGNKHTLVREHSFHGADLQLKDNVFVIREESKGHENSVFESWYKHALYGELQKILPRWTLILNLNPSTVNIKTVKSIWGSCSAKGNLTFSTRLALVPPELLEYVVVHELCHMIHMNHSSLFWAEVAKHINDCKERRLLLRKNEQIYKWW